MNHRLGPPTWTKGSHPSTVLSLDDDRRCWGCRHEKLSTVECLGEQPCYDYPGPVDSVIYLDPPATNEGHDADI